jgi:hypothetical protein
MDIACSYCQIPINVKKDTWFYIHEPGKPDTSAHQRCYDEFAPRWGRARPGERGREVGGKVPVGPAARSRPPRPAHTILSTPRRSRSTA